MILLFFRVFGREADSIVFINEHFALCIRRVFVAGGQGEQYCFGWPEAVIMKVDGMGAGDS